MENPHWTSIGRDIATQAVDMNKGQRVALVRTCATSLGLSAHTVRRFVVLAQFAEKLGISGSRTSQLPIGTMEILYRIHDHNPAEAKVALTDLLRGDLSYGAALKRLDNVVKFKSDEERASEPDEVLKRIATLVGVENPANLVELRSDDIGTSRLSRSTCLYKVGDKIISYISETAMMVENQRGIRKLSRIIVLSACESDIVVVDFMSYDSHAAFQKHAKGVRQAIRDRIKPLDVY